jgi:hypothetical protein
MFVSIFLPFCRTNVGAAVLLIRTYAFFNRNVYVLMFLVAAMTGVVAYQLYVDTSQMLCMLAFAFIYGRNRTHRLIIVLPFVTPPFVRLFPSLNRR